jgi:hypothetical protein
MQCTDRSAVSRRFQQLFQLLALLRLTAVERDVLGVCAQVAVGVQVKTVVRVLRTTTSQHDM